MRSRLPVQTGHISSSHTSHLLARTTWDVHALALIYFKPLINAWSADSVAHFPTIYLLEWLEKGKGIYQCFIRHLHQKLTSRFSIFASPNNALQWLYSPRDGGGRGGCRICRRIMQYGVEVCSSRCPLDILCCLCSLCCKLGCLVWSVWRVVYTWVFYEFTLGHFVGSVWRVYLI